MSITTRFTETYRIRHPIACAAMAFATLSPRLPVAVCEAGAVGAFAVGPFPPDFIRANVNGIRRQTEKPFNLNFITPFATADHIELSAALRPEIVSFHWEIPPPEWIQRLQDAGVHVWQQIGTLEAAREAATAGMDAVIVQGAEAGGHCYGKHPLMVLLPAVLDAVAERCLVLAAGGIVDGRGVAAVLAMGADAAMLGTRLLATEESDVADEYKQRIVTAGPGDTVLSSMFGRDLPDFNPMRLIRNTLVNEWHDRVAEIDQLGEQPVIGAMNLAGQAMELHRFSSLLPVAGATGDFEQMPLTAGAGLGGIDSIQPARQVIEDIADQAQRSLQRLLAT
ncbi:MAG: nitronate monooxygenase [Gammaproteobacteria bacterium]|nr:nitronate monooxygenase [Gammaproteobacteria bacterium]